MDIVDSGDVSGEYKHHQTLIYRGMHLTSSPA